jgi:excisionase family DNA binding protein
VFALVCVAVTGRPDSGGSATRHPFLRSVESMDGRNGLLTEGKVESDGVPAGPGAESSAATRQTAPDSAVTGSAGAGDVERVTLQEAATRLGVGITTARRWVRSGRLKALREETPQGHTWRVLLPAGSPTRPGAGARPSGNGVPSNGDSSAAATDSLGVREVARLEAHVADLRMTVADLREQLGRKDEELAARRREVQELHVLLGRAQLPMPIDAVAVADSTAETGGTPEGTPRTDTGMDEPDSDKRVTSRPPWWRRLLFG